MQENLCRILVVILILFLSACSAVPSNWGNSAKIADISEDLTTLLIEGYPPFTVEFYDNPLFDGAAKVCEMATTLEYTVQDSSKITVGSPYYLRIKSSYSSGWMVYGGSDDPTMVMVTSGNEGTSTNPYIIRTKADLIALSKGDAKYGDPTSSIDHPWSKYYVLAHDIDLTGVDWTPIGNNSIYFTGYFNGAGHIISGLNSITPKDTDYAGFFGRIAANMSSMSDPVVENLGLKIGDISLGSYVNYFGVLSGYSRGTGMISNCYVVGSSIEGKTSRTGGLCGTSYLGIENCFTDISVVRGNSTYLGGLVGIACDLSGVTFDYCYSAGNVLAEGSTTAAGGFTGQIMNYNASATVTDCVAVNSQVKNSSDSSAALYFFGYGLTAGAVCASGCYYNRKMVCPDGSVAMNDTVSAIPINLCTMNQSSAPFVNWDFDELWKWDTATNRPRLRKVRY